MHYGVELREFTYEADGTGEKEHGADLTAPAASAMPPTRALMPSGYPSQMTIFGRRTGLLRAVL
jgi:hypothetical protein